MVCAFSGHRPQRLDWGDNEEDPRCVALKIKMQQELERLIEKGTHVFICGMAHGCDFYFAEAVLELQKTYGDIQLIGALPHKNQETSWPLEEQKRFHRLCAQCTTLHLMQEQYSKWCMSSRNLWMVSQADVLLTVYDGGTGGTKNTIGHAQRLGVTIIGLWL